MSYIIGCDTGGTFTDVSIVDEKGMITSGKALSTPPAFTEGIIKGLEVTAESLGKTMDEVLQETELFVLGSTIATNTVINRLGVKTGLITTSGFEDTHHFARGGVSKWAGLSEQETREAYRTKKAEPLVPKSLTRGVSERIDWKGSVVCRLDIEEAKEAVKSLVDEGVESIAVSLLWSFKNPTHENEIKKILDGYPRIYSSISSKLAPALGEYARTNTVIIDSYVGPVVKKFLASLDEILTNKGHKLSMLVMQASGGCVFGSEALPYATFGSGPAAGVIGSRYLGETMGHKNIITTDVGGTSFDVSLISDGSLIYAREPVIDQFTVSFPLIDVISIGAGGGSIASVEPVTGVPQVGPRSAGAKPGPVCYGFGGMEPTVTDADLVLGYLNPDYFLGGKMKLYPEKAREALDKLGHQLGWDATTTAAAIYDIANANMAGLVRSATIERGYDPREFVLFSYGGNGPMHAAIYGSEIGVKEILVPSAASTYSALGLASTDILHSYRMFELNPMPMDPGRFNKNFETLENMAHEELERDGIKPEERTMNFALDMRWGGQYYVVRLPVAAKKYDAKGVEEVCDQFDVFYESLYGKGSFYEEAGRFVISFIVDGVGRTPKPVLQKYELKGDDASEALKGKRKCFFRVNNDFVDTSIYDCDKLEPGNVTPGPAIIEASQLTVVIPPGQRGTMDEYRNISIK
jgi:N-methylhydantoinase A